MGHKYKMSQEDRAKQFMPFSALRGYEEALRRKEKMIAERRVLSEDAREELDSVLQQMEKGMSIKVQYYAAGEYVEKSGILSKIDLWERKLWMEDTKIDFDDIYDIIKY